MWLSVGSSSSLIDDIGQVGMFEVSDHITSPSLRELAYLSGGSLRQTTRSGAALKIEL